MCVLIAISSHRSQAAASPLAASDLGQTLFERNCVVCHGMGGSGGRGPALNRPHLELVPDQAALRTLIRAGLPPEMPGNEFLSDPDIEQVAAYVRSLGAVGAQVAAGSVPHGTEVFASNGCPFCHVVAGKGNAYGPELTEIGERRGIEHIRQSIIKPDADLPADFLVVSVVTGAGQVIQGIRINEDTFSIQLKDSNGALYSFRKADQRELHKLRGTTPMPSFDGVLGDSDLADLVAYLSSLRGNL